jgi:outer membrane protein TolC
MEALNYQRQLLDIIRQLEAINDELAQAKPRLASLMNLEPGKPYQLATPGQLAVPKLTMTLPAMEETALLRRPEMMEARYNERISVSETRRAMARLLPGVEFSIGAHYDSNSFATNNNWRDAGMRVSWNLFNILNASTIRATADAQREVALQQRLALSMALLTQTHVALRDYMGRMRQYELSAEMDTVDQRILSFSRNAARTDSMGKLQLVRASASALISELRVHQSHGALQGAYGQMLATLGLDPLPATVSSHDLPAVRQAVLGMESRWATELSGKR